MSLDQLPAFVREHYETHEWRHASAVLATDFPGEFAEICQVLTGFRLNRSAIVVGGGRKSKVSEAIDSALYAFGWIEKDFKTQIKVDQRTYDSPTHKVDCFKNGVGLEVELNNKDPFFGAFSVVDKIKHV